MQSAKAAPTFVGANVCAECHQADFKLWKGSHHQLSMQPATAATVLGNFNHSIFINGSVTTVFYRSGSKFMVRTDGPDGALHDYQIKFTFGVHPLQQYLIAMPGGRLQALGIAWDSRSRIAGGQRWFFLYPEQKITYSNPLHWTGIEQNWNYMCADCHSTNVRKNYDLQKGTFSTSYAEIDVACEACHGPGSYHVAWAKKQGQWKRFDANEGLTVSFEGRRGVSWSIDPATGDPRRSRPRTSEREIQVCARCHSRRGEIHEDYLHGQPAGDDYRIALLGPNLYFPDGQIKGEVYEYGSFIQSRMYHSGVTCTDCHDPHSLKLRAQGNRLCLRCHSARYDSPKHYFHKVGSAGAECVSCHMPTRMYMVVDPRRDHSIKIPRPDLSIKLGVPNACNQCHTDKSAQWALAWIKRWYGHKPVGFQRFAETLNMGAERAPGAQQALRALISNTGQPAIARAEALSMLAAYAPSPNDPVIRAAISDPSPLVRRAAAQALANSDPNASAATLAPLLNDPVRAVRLEAAEVLAGTPRRVLTPSVASALNKAVDEYVNSQELNADRPESHLDLALIFVRERKLGQAESELKIALSVDPTFVPAAVNLADLYRQENRDTQGETVLRDAIRRSPEDAALRYALGLLMVRRKQSAKAFGLFADAVRLNPANSQYAYVYALALDGSGDMAAAIETLKRILKIHPYDRDVLEELVNLCNKAGERAEALNYARRLSELDLKNGNSDPGSQVLPVN